MLFKGSVFVSALFALSNAAHSNPKVLTGLAADGVNLTVYKDFTKQLTLVTFNGSTPAKNFVEDKFELIYHGGSVDAAYLKKEAKKNTFQIRFLNHGDPDPAFKFVGKKLTYKSGFSFIKCNRTIESFTGETLMMVNGTLRDKTCKKIKSVTKLKA